MSEKNIDPDHACRYTCAGWRQGWERGYDAGFENSKEEMRILRIEIEQLKCPHSVDVLGICEWCGAGAEPEHLDKPRTK